MYCHPIERSYGAALHTAVLDGLAEKSHQVTDIDLYAEGFDPVLRKEDWYNYYNTDKNAESVRRYAEQLQVMDALVLIYPSWWYGLPAMLKGYFDRVWLPGIAFDVMIDGRIGTDRLRRLRRILVVTTYGSPWWLIKIYMGDPTRKIVERGLKRICGRPCRVRWYAKYNMDRSSKRDLQKFLERVRRGAARIAE